MNIKDIKMTDNKAEAIMYIAIDFWSDKGKSIDDIKKVFSHGTKELREKFLKPAINIYIMLMEEFNKEV